MRSIKFRGIATVNDKHNNIKVGDFVYGCFVETNIDCQILFGDGEQISVDRKTVGQFTGLSDKSSVEIYEGDIIPYRGKFYEVEMLGPCWTFKGYEEVEYHGYDAPESQDWSEFEVVGNIHQNKELVKV